MQRNLSTLGGLCALLLVIAGRASGAPVALHVDATDAPRRIVRTQMSFSAKPGKLTLLYPKWIPGHHSPSGPIADVVGLKVSASGKPLQWRRDPENMYAFDVDVPAGATGIDVAMEFFLPAGKDAGSVTENLLCLNWNEVLLYPAGAAAREIQYEAALKLPAGWNFGTALQRSRGDRADGAVMFSAVSLETLVDSPLIAGRFFRSVELTPGQDVAHLLHLVSDSAAALEIKPQDVAKLSRLIAESDALFGARHYRSYHFLLTLSDHIDAGGLEHHESSDNRTDEETLIDEDRFKLNMGLLPHELVHSWNGKYRRPADIATSDFQQPMKTELLWVYEGLTTYLGDVLTARAGITSDDLARQALALEAARLEHVRGRDWRPLADTAVAAQLLYGSGRAGPSRRRGVDFYPEGKLIWLEADVLIRQKTAGERSLDDFCRLFFGGETSGPKVVPYSYDDLLTALDKVAPNDWRQFFDARVRAVNRHAPLGGIEGGGWRLTFVERPGELLKSLEKARHFTDVTWSLGFSLGKEGELVDVVPDSPADRAGLAPGMNLVAVNGRKSTPELLRAAIKSAKPAGGPIELLVESNDFYKSCKLDHRDGERYPALERNEAMADVLSQVFKPRTAPPPAQ
jgi:predicted metalloprotease with PDZ domain